MMTSAQPVAYIRRSVASRADPGDVSREFQTEEVRRLAGDDADRLVIIDRDWGRSAATDKTGRRLAFLAMLEDIEAGDVSALYAYSADRLARSVEWSARLLNACRRAGVTITTGEGTFRPDDDAATDLFNFRAVVNESTLRQMEKKARATVARRKARNVEAGREPNAGLGGKPYGPEVTAQVLAAYDQAGSFLGACKLLTAPVGAEVWSRGRLVGTGLGVPSRLSGRPNPRQNGGTYGWNFRTVGRIVRRERSDVPKVGRQGAAQRPRRLLSGLLVCHCGQILAPNGSANYTCRQAHNDSSHSRPYTVGERLLLPWLKAELAHLRLPVDAVTMGREASAERADLVTQRERLALGYARGGLTQATYEAEDGALVARLAELGDTEDAADVSPILPEEWDTWTPGDLDRYIRSILERVDLGPDMRPVSATWRNPALRRACDDPACTHCPARRSAEVSEARSVVAGEVVTMTGAEAMQARLSQAIDDLQADRITLAESRKITAEANRELRKIERALRS
jgi:DNA invertase Pin-like site-specific DNA recombinase